MLVFFFHSPSNRGTFFPNNFASQLPIPKEGKLKKWPAPREKSSQRRWLAWGSLSDAEGCAGAGPWQLCLESCLLPSNLCSIVLPRTPALSSLLWPVLSLISLKTSLQRMGLPPPIISTSHFVSFLIMNHTVHWACMGQHKFRASLTHSSLCLCSVHKLHTSLSEVLEPSDVPEAYIQRHQIFHICKYLV